MPTPPVTTLPAGLRLVVDPAPAPDFRAELARRIHAFHAETVAPYRPDRFALRLEDAQGGWGAGLVGVLAWEWLFLEAVWVDPGLRGTGAGRALVMAAERHAAAAGCHSAWLDTFQARGFYEALGYAVFGVLEDYPPGQQRAFLRKRLKPIADERERSSA